MIGKLQGIVDYIGEGFIIVDVGGVGYRVFCPANVLSSLCSGDAATLWIETNVREDHIHLFGFESRAQQELFVQLTSVSGVGPKVGMAIIGAFRADILTTTIVTGDAQTLTAAPGVGKKVADRIIVELKGKCGKWNVESGTDNRNNSTLSDLLSALESLGYRRADVVELAQKLSRGNPDAEVGVLVRLALKEMVK